MNTIAFPGSRNIHGTEVYFEMQTLEWIKANNHTTYTAIHEQQSFEMIYVTEGSGVHCINYEQYELCKNTIYCVAPGYSHKLMLDPGTKGYLLSFSESFLATHRDLHDYEPDGYIYTQFHNYPSLAVDAESSEEMKDILSMIDREMKKHGLKRMDLLNRYLRIYLILFQREVISSIPTIREKVQYGLTDKFFLLLEYNFKQKKSVNAYAKELCVTPNYLNQMIKRATGQSARYHITQRILQEAKRKLSQPDITMKEVAFMLGFDDIAHFSKFFKNGTGFTFSTLKKRCAGERAQLI
ncbi:AraC-like DNA-binding protein [Filimonas zeae]|uniref:Transcriptional regulator n=1 Tax=Filimonas zeae TaxID=1737353 RepID=A0A917MUF0_9BACT|nr:helix-turn-helix domain-containing protein [Filimonas zeae]MDR6339241.1 AraC-like DNA-binding protein [Filimonas zeae]GGH64467.1 transcriptional regulator [Filimonas zeae]